MNRPFNRVVIEPANVCRAETQSKGGSSSSSRAATTRLGIGARPSPGAARLGTSNAPELVKSPAPRTSPSSATLMRRMDERGRVILLVLVLVLNLGYWLLALGYSRLFHHES
jgi:hypothetical protein